MNPERFRKLRSVLDRRQPDLTVLMERVHKPHNLSAIVRNADAVGVLEAHAVPLDDVLKLPHDTSAGSAKWVNVRTHASVREAAHHLRGRGFRLLAAHRDAEARDFREVDLTAPVAFLVGAELEGLSSEAIELADEVVSIPMVGMVRSLNVSVAASLLLYEAYRQRERAGFYDSRRLPEEQYRRLLFEWSHPEVAIRLRRAGVEYPDLDEDGEILPAPGRSRGLGASGTGEEVRDSGG